MPAKESKTTRNSGAERGAAPKGAPKSGGMRVLWILVALVVVAVIGVGGFAAGVYFKWIDIAGVSAKYGLHRYPLVGRYLPQPQTNFEPVEASAPQPVTPAPSTVQPVQQTPPPAPLPPDPAELEKQQKAKVEEGKRISRLARLYGAMKPEEAVTIINQLDDETAISIFSRMEDEQVAKIMAAMDAKRSARITQTMFKGKKETP